MYWQDGDKMLIAEIRHPMPPERNFRYLIDPVITYIGKHNNEHKLIGRYFSINNNSVKDRNQYDRMNYLEYRYRQSLKDSV